MGIAFDGDFDRCFFFDENGNFVPGEYIVGLLAEIFLLKEPGSKIIHDSRVIWNIKDVVENHSGYSLVSKTGHAFIKNQCAIIMLFMVVKCQLIITFVNLPIVIVG